MDQASIRNDVATSNFDSQHLDSLGLGHSLVLYWKACEEDFETSPSCELLIGPDDSQYIGCDEDEERLLSRYATHFAGFTIKSSYFHDISEGVVDRVFKENKPEMSPNISYYSLAEYPLRDFALSCGILASFCFPLYETDDDDYECPIGVLEVVSTRNQDVGAVRKFCESFKEFHWVYTFPSIHLPKDAEPEIEQLLEVVCQKFQLPLAQYWIHSMNTPVVNQFSCRDFANSAPWFHFKHACLQMQLFAYQECGAHFCRDITALSITQYPFAHYARSCGSIACFSIYLYCGPPIDKHYVLEFFLPSQEMDNDYTQTLLNSIWATVRVSLPNCKLASGEHFRQVLSVKVINSSTQTKPEYFELGHPHSSVPHHEVSGYTSTSKLFENGPEQKSNSNSHEKAGTGETSLSVDESEKESDVMCTEPHSLASQHKKPEKILKYKGTTEEISHSERVDNLVEVSPGEEVEYAVTIASKRMKKSKIPCTAENISKHFGRPLKDAAESFGVSVSTFKRRCRDVGIDWWQPGKSKITDGEPGGENFSSDMPRVQDTPAVAHTGHELNKMDVKLMYNGVPIRFELSSSSGISELENNVIERLPLNRKSFSIKYEDDEGDWVLIACDKDVQKCFEISKSLKKTTIRMLLDPPMNCCAP